MHTLTAQYDEARIGVSVSPHSESRAVYSLTGLTYQIMKSEMVTQEIAKERVAQIITGACRELGPEKAPIFVDDALQAPAEDVSPTIIAGRN